MKNGIQMIDYQKTPLREEIATYLEKNNIDTKSIKVQFFENLTTDKATITGFVNELKGKEFSAMTIWYSIKIVLILILITNGSGKNLTLLRSMKSFKHS